jgi:transcriptional regulator with XRE-family HTH domain
MPTLRIKQLRKAAGLSQAELAAAADMTQSTVSRLESGAIALDADSAKRIASALSCTVDDLVDHDAQPVPDTHDAAVIPSLSQRPGWNDVLARAKSDAPDIEAEDWDTLAQSPGLFAFDVPLTPALLVELAKVVRRHRPPKK